MPVSWCSPAHLQAFGIPTCVSGLGDLVLMFVPSPCSKVMFIPSPQAIGNRLQADIGPGKSRNQSFVGNTICVVMMIFQWQSAEDANQTQESGVKLPLPFSKTNNSWRSTAQLHLKETNDEIQRHTNSWRHRTVHKSPGCLSQNSSASLRNRGS